MESDHMDEPPSFPVPPPDKEPNIFDGLFEDVTQSPTYRAAKAAQDENRTEAALALMHDLVSQFPKHPLAYYSLGEAFMAECQNDQAVSAFRHALDLAREYAAQKSAEAQSVKAIIDAHIEGVLVSTSCWQAMAVIHIEAGEMAQARQCFASSVSEIPEDTPAWKGLLEISKLTGNKRIRAHAYRGLSRFGSVPMPYWVIRIKRFLRARRYRAALAACRKAMETDPNYPAVWRLLGKTYDAMAERASLNEGNQLCLTIVQDVYRKQAEQAYGQALDRNHPAPARRELAY